MSRSFLRLLVTAVAGLFGGFAGLGLVAALDAAIGLEPDNTGVLLLLFLTAFVGGIFVAARLAGRLTARWVEAPFAGFSAADRSNEPPLASLHPASEDASGAPGYIPFETNGELHRLVRVPPAPSLPPGLILVGSLVLFLVSSDDGGTVEHLAILAGVLLFHEAGHALGMIALGYRDVRIFFIPFFGAATAGKPDGGPGWRQGIVLLLGPVPGILVGAALALVAGSSPTTTAGYAARMLIYVNIFNLLPVMPLDGGRLLELLVFDRHRVPLLTWRIVSAAAFAFLGLRFRTPLLAVIAGFQLLGLPGTWAVATAASALRRGPHPIPIPIRIEDTPDTLIDAVHNLHLDPKWGKQSTAARASWIRMVVERAVSAGRAPGLLGSLGLAAAWVVSTMVAFVAIVISAQTR